MDKAELNVAGNSFSSSLLPMTDRHLQSAPDSAYVATECVPTARLESMWEDCAGPAQTWLKLDVQGLELEVLRGVGERIADVRVVQSELSLVPLYDGGVPWRTIVDWLRERGFSLAAIEPGFDDPATGRMLQFDGIFITA